MYAACRGFDVGKLDEDVFPARQTLPCPSTATARPFSSSLPPRKEEYTKEVPEEVRLARKASNPIRLGGFMEFRMGKSLDRLNPTT